MSFVGLDKFLERFRKITPPDIVIRKTFVFVVQDQLKIKLNTKQVSFNKKTSTLYLKTKGVNRSVFFINKETLLTTLNKKLRGALVVSEIVLN